MYKLLALSAVATIGAIYVGSQIRWENDSLRRQLAANISADEEKKRAWEALVKERQAEVDKANRRHEDSEERSRGLEGRVQELEAQLDKSETKSRSLEGKVQILEAHVEELDKELEDLAWNGNIEADRLIEIAERLKGEKADLESQVRDLMSRNAYLEQETKTASSSLSPQSHSPREESGEGNGGHLKIDERSSPGSPPLYPGDRVEYE